MSKHYATIRSIPYIPRCLRISFEPHDARIFYIDGRWSGHTFIFHGCDYECSLVHLYPEEAERIADIVLDTRDKHEAPSHVEDAGEEAAANGQFGVGA